MPKPPPPAKPRPRADNSAIEQVVASLAHEIRTPLNGIMALSELLAASDLSDREKQWARAIRSAADHLASYTTLVCDGVRANATGLTLREDVFSPRKLALSIATALTARTQSAELTAIIAISPDLPEALRGDVTRLRAAIENLIDNAVKFTARGSIRFAMDAQGGEDGVMLTVAVGDSGTGLSEEEIARLFQPFAQANEDVARKFGGAGLGLTLVKRLAQAMGGDVTIASVPREGSTFTLTVKMQPADAAELPEATATRLPRQGRSLNILCAEDNPYGRVVMETVLGELGHRVEFVGSGMAAIAAVRSGGYDLVLMDIGLPGLDGLSATRRIRSLPAPAGRIPIIAISASEEQDTAREAGVNDYLLKPVAPVTLAASLGKLRLD